jgi:hypothetical protein
MAFGHAEAFSNILYISRPIGQAWGENNGPPIRSTWNVIKLLADVGTVRIRRYIGIRLTRDCVLSKSRWAHDTGWVSL